MEQGNGNSRSEQNRKDEMAKKILINSIMHGTKEEKKRLEWRSAKELENREGMNARVMTKAKIKTTTLNH